MNFFEKYSVYLKDNPQGYWFKRKLYGWGWTPAKKEGWLVILLYLIGLVYIININNIYQAEMGDRLTGFLTQLILLTLVLLFICYKKGEKPKWQWGK